MTAHLSGAPTVHDAERHAFERPAMGASAALTSLPTASPPHTSQAFGTLIASVRNSLRELPEDQSNRLAEQMFEPRLGNARQHRLAILEKEAKATTQSEKADLRFHRTSPQARREQRLDGSGRNSAESMPGRGSVQTPLDEASGLMIQDASTQMRRQNALPSVRGENARPNDGVSSNVQRFDRLMAGSNGSPPHPGSEQSSVSGRGAGIQDKIAGVPGPVASHDSAKADPTLARQIGSWLSGAREPVGQAARVANIAVPREFPLQTTPRLVGREVSLPKDSNRPSQNAAQLQLTEAEKSRLDQLVRSITMQLGARRSAARLRLHPPELGHVRVNVRIVEQRLQIDVQAESDAARQMIAQRAARLQSALESHGLLVDRFDVVTNEDAQTGPRSGLPANAGAVLRESTARRPLRFGVWPRDGAQDQSKVWSTSKASGRSTDGAVVRERRLDVRA